MNKLGTYEGFQKRFLLAYLDVICARLCHGIHEVHRVIHGEMLVGNLVGRQCLLNPIISGPHVTGYNR